MATLTRFRQLICRATDDILPGINDIIVVQDQLSIVSQLPPAGSICIVEKVTASTGGDDVMNA